MLTSRIIGIFQTIECIIALALVALCFAGLPFGVQHYVVLSGSMEPTFHVGALVYVQPDDTNTYEVGDAVAFHRGNNTITHRIVDIDEQTGLFVTQGDANADPDPAGLEKSDIIGRVVGTVPVVGYVIAWIQDYKVETIAALVLVNIILAGIAAFARKRWYLKRGMTEYGDLIDWTVDDEDDEYDDISGVQPPMTEIPQTPVAPAQSPVAPAQSAPSAAVPTGVTMTQSRAVPTQATPVTTSDPMAASPTHSTSVQ